MLFESEAKAKTFMRFNSEEIEELNGRAPVRAYFCEACAGWHLTSMEQPLNYSPTQRMIDSTNKASAKKKEARLRSQVQRYRGIVSLVADGQYRTAFLMLIGMLHAIAKYEAMPGADLHAFQQIKDEGPEIADIILTKMYEELQALNVDADVSYDKKREKEQHYRKSVQALENLGDCYKVCLAKHVKNLRNL